MPLSFTIHLCACDYQKAVLGLDMLRERATLLKTKERLLDYKWSAPRSPRSQKTTYVCNVLLCLLLLQSLLWSKEPTSSKGSGFTRCRWLSSGGLDAHHLGLVCLGLKVYINLPLDTEMLLHNPHIPHSISKQDEVQLMSCCGIF